MKLPKELFFPFIFLALVGCNRSWSSGDRVLVSKFQYDMATPDRFDVVVFKYPEKPVEAGVPKNYIKRLLGLPGEIIAIFFGQLFHWRPGEGEPPPYEQDDKDVEPTKLWTRDHTHSALFSLGRDLEGVEPEWMNGGLNNTRKMKKWFETPGKFEILRKPPEVMLDMRRIVFDNDFQPTDLKIRRWNPASGSGWKAADDFRSFTFESAADKLDFLRYQHIVVPRGGPRMFNDNRNWEDKPALITDFMGYNSFVLAGGFDPQQAENWVGDLMLECDLKVEKSQGEFVMELSRGVDRFRARFDLQSGNCTLLRQSKDGWKELATKPTSVKSPGTYALRFSNFDSRLTVWVKNELPFGEGHAYPPPEIRSKEEETLSVKELLARLGPTDNDLEPASIAGKGADVAVSHLRLWRDTYYTTGTDGADAHLQHDDWANPSRWGPLKNLDVRTMYIQPGHYLCLGDNSTASSDSRSWGLVPHRLMLGRALLVYYPLSRIGPIR